MSKTKLASGPGVMCHWITCLCIALVFACIMPVTLHAQEDLPGDPIAAPDGTNLLLDYYVYGHERGFKPSGGPEIRRSGLEVNLGAIEYIRYKYIFGMPAGIQVFDIFGSQSGGHIGNQRLGSAVGAQNATVALFLHPIADAATRRYLKIQLTLYPPGGTYDKNSALNVGPPNWRGQAQAGWEQGIGEHFAYDLAFSVGQTGGTTAPNSIRTRVNPDFQLQGFLIWNWTAAFQTAVGYEGIYGGSIFRNGLRSGQKADFSRLRATAALFVLPSTQVLVELNRDIQREGGFRQAFGATMRIAYIF